MVMRKFRNVYKFIRKSILIISGLLVLVFTIQYITCPVYKFEAGKPFTGEYFYNPYQNIKPDEWRKGNFQIQSRAWGSITAGSGNSNEAVHSLYKSLGYDIIATSDYQKINRYLEEDPAYVPVYEHGYGLKKNHQILIGSKRVLWKDYVFFQNLNNKQHILNSLRPDNELTIIAHPKLKNGYAVNDMRYLANYDGIEVLNNFRTSLQHWDAALSAGHYVTILGNDDAHDISKPDEIGHHCTLINAPSVDKADIIHSLRTGKAIGALIERPLGETMEDKIKRTKKTEKLLRADVVNDTIFVKTDSQARAIRFYGQNGDFLKKEINTNSAFYPIKESDTYVRTEIEFHSDNVYYLNPVCRYDGNQPSKMAVPEIDSYKTWRLRILGFATLIFLLVNAFWIRKKVKEQNHMK
jgi:hypothetical protein